jgi:hypothetical protein
MLSIDFENQVLDLGNMNTKDTCLVVVDTNAFLHAVNYRLKGLHHITQTILTYNTLYLLSGAYLESLGVKQFDIVLASDLKPYWRLHHLFTYHGVNYKESRGKDPMKNKEIEVLRGYLQTYLVSKGILSVKMWCREKINDVSVGYEADDIAAGIVRTISPSYKHTYLLTDDSDWLPLTSDTVTWCGIAGYQPRIRKPEIILDWVKQHDKFSGEKSTKAKKAFIWESHKDIWKFKSIFGDKADGIAGDKDIHKYSPYIDLENPIAEFGVWNEPTFREKIDYCMLKNRQTIPMATIRERAKSIPLFMSGY